MKQKYFDRLMGKTPHERRQHAMQVASVAVALVFVVWLTTLGVRFASTTPPQTADSSDSSQVASVVSADSGNATLMVATSTDSYTAFTPNNY